MTEMRLVLGDINYCYFSQSYQLGFSSLGTCIISVRISWRLFFKFLGLYCLLRITSHI